MCLFNYFGCNNASSGVRDNIRPSCRVAHAKNKDCA